MPSQFEVTAGKAAGPTTGGTVTQATNKSTAVTLNTESGQITMNNAALADAAEVTFQVNNDRVAATDVVVVNHGSAGTAGAVKVTVGNLSGGSLSQAIVLNFVLLKGASS